MRIANFARHCQCGICGRFQSCIYIRCSNPTRIVGWNFRVNKIHSFHSWNIWKSIYNLFFFLVGKNRQKEQSLPTDRQWLSKWLLELGGLWRSMENVKVENGIRLFWESHWRGYQWSSYILWIFSNRLNEQFKYVIWFWKDLNKLYD